VTTVAPAASTSPGWRRWAVDIYLAIRFSTLGFTGLLPLVGMASVAPGWDGARGAWLLAIALSFHVFAYMLNDVVDLWVDRTEPLRADSPLVRGAISRAHALALALAQPPLALFCAQAAGASLAAIGWLVLAFAAMAAYDLWGKRCPWPLLTDAVQSVGWCALLAAGAAFDGASPGAATGWIAAYVFLCVMLVNGVHGALRDLANDQARGARTTAAWFGARAGVGTAVHVPPALTAYALALQAGLAASAGFALAALAAGPLTQAAVALALLVGATTLARGFRRIGDRRGLVATGAVNIVATLLVLPLLALARLGPTGSGVLLLVFTLPVLAMWVYNGSHWRLAPPTETQA